MDVDIKLDFNEIFDKAFSALAKAMNIAEEQLLPIMVKQMFIEGVFGLSMYVLFFAIFSGMVLLGVFKMYREDLKEMDIAILIVGAIGLFVWFMTGFAPQDASLYGIQGAVTKVFNPEYAVMVEVVDMAKGLIGK